jgi:toxin ParE1/3/4
LAKLRYAPEAKSDLADIWSYIAIDNPRAADHLVSDIMKRCEMLSRLPRIGRLREELAPQLRSFAVGNYVIFYRIKRGGLYCRARFEWLSRSRQDLS